MKKETIPRNIWWYQLPSDLYFCIFKNVQCVSIFSAKLLECQRVKLAKRKATWLQHTFLVVLGSNDSVDSVKPNVKMLRSPVTAEKKKDHLLFVAFDFFETLRTWYVVIMLMQNLLWNQLIWWIPPTCMLCVVPIPTGDHQSLICPTPTYTQQLPSKHLTSHPSTTAVVSIISLRLHPWCLPKQSSATRSHKFRGDTEAVINKKTDGWRIIQWSLGCLGTLSVEKCFVWRSYLDHFSDYGWLPSIWKNENM